jgi:TP901 family phage tail tape measure protein
LGVEQNFEFVADTSGIVGPLNEMAAVMQNLEQTANSTGVSLAKLTTSANGFQAAVRGSPGQVSAFNSALQANQSILSAQVNKLSLVKDATEETGKNMAGAFDRVTLSWTGLLRLFQVQALHQIFGALSQELQASVESAAKFQTKIAEIQTISQGAQQTTQQWTKQLAGLSEEFGKPQLDVAQAAYETLSNQIAKGAQSTAFLRDALNFAVTTNSSATDSVNLLSSALNSYQLDAGQAERVSAIFFKTIDLGRVKASELANTFGRIAPFAAQLGVSLEETAAGISTITRVGVPASEAIVFLNNVFTALVKPTKEMQATLAKWGVSTGEAAIATFGFQGVLHKLTDEAQLGSSHIAQLFQNIRGLKGINALSREIQGFDSDLKALGQQANIEFAKAQEIVKQTDAFKFNQLKQEISNFFTNEIGGQVIHNLIQLKESVGDVREPLTVLFEVVKAGAESFIAWRVALAAIPTATVALQAIIPQITNLSSLFGGLTTQTQTWKQTLNDPNLGVNLANAFAAGFAIEQLFEAALNANEQNKTRQRAKESAAFKAGLDEQTKSLVSARQQQDQIVIESLRKQSQLGLTALSESRKTALQAAKDTSEAYTNVIDELKIHLGTFLDTLRQKIADTKSSISTLTSIIKSVRGDFEENIRGLGPSLFNSALGGSNPVAQIESQIQGISERIKEVFQRSLTNIPVADSEGLKFVQDDIRLTQKLFDEKNKLIIKEVELEQKQNSAADREIASLQKRFESFTKAQAAVENFSGRFSQRITEDGQHQVELAQKVQRAEDDLAKARRNNDSADTILKRTRAINDAQQRLTDFTNKEGANTSNRLQQQAQLEQKVTDARSKLNSELQKTGGIEASAIARLLEANDLRLAQDKQIEAAATSRREKLKEELVQQEEALKRAAQASTQVEKFSLVDTSGKVKDEFKDAPEKAIQKLKEAQDAVRKQLPEGISVDLKFKLEKDFAEQLNTLKEQIIDQVRLGNLDATALRFVEGARDLTKAIEANTANIKKQLGDIDESLTNIKTKLDDLNAASKSPSLRGDSPAKDAITSAAIEIQKALGDPTLGGVRAEEARKRFADFTDQVQKFVSGLQAAKSKLSETGDTTTFNKNLDDLSRGFEKAKKELQSVFDAVEIKPETLALVKSQLAEIGAEIKNLAVERDKLIKSVQDSQNTKQGADLIKKTDFKEVVDEFTGLQEQLSKEAKTLDIADPGQTVRIEQLQKRLRDLSGTLGEIQQKSKISLDKLFTNEQFDQFTEAQRKIIEAQAEIESKREKNQRSLLQEAQDDVAVVGETVDLAISSMDAFFSNAETQINSLRESLLSLNNIVISPQIALSPSGPVGAPQTFAHGGFVDMFRPRGFDVIPAMLRPGEIVMNPEVSSKFRSQLLALNAGGNPQYFSKGGEVTNVGGITIHVQGGDTSGQTIQAIGRGLNRLARRGAFKFNS